MSQTLEQRATRVGVGGKAERRNGMEVLSEAGRSERTGQQAREKKDLVRRFRSFCPRAFSPAGLLLACCLPESLLLLLLDTCLLL